ncbi:MAG: hypothetical protein CSB24_02305 [Deltaproteobacteria bacterium]|nr:MAG: hypothetical protein CSB24_02305 [Deltaproteobacteria bacterium]
MQEARKEREFKVIKRAFEDADFRNKLLSGDAKSLIEETAGVEFPAGMKVEVIEEKPDTMIFVLPRDIGSEVSLTGQLSDEELEEVAGGKGGIYGDISCSMQKGGAAVNTHSNIDV